LVVDLFYLMRSTQHSVLQPGMPAGFYRNTDLVPAHSGPNDGRYLRIQSRTSNFPN
jgi:hypothetical protein